MSSEDPFGGLFGDPEEFRRRLVVLDGGRLTGIVTLDDLASRTGDSELASQLAGRVTRAVMPDFFFHERGDH